MNDFSDVEDEEVFDNRHGRRGKNDYGPSYCITAEIPDFNDIIELEGILDWLYEVEKFFDIMDFPEDCQVKIFAYKLRAGVAAWWDHVQEGRR